MVAKQTVDESLALDILAFARKGYLSPETRGQCSWKRGGKKAGTVFFVARHDALDLIYDLGSFDAAETLHRAYRVPLERTPARLGGERVWFLCPACHTRARKLYLPPGRTYFLCRTCHQLSYASRQTRDPAPVKTLERIETLTTTLADSKIDSRRWRRIYRETEEAVCAFGESDFLTEVRRPLRSRAKRKAAPEEAPVKRGRGRPKEKRPYVRRAPFTEGGKESLQESLCMRCRDYRQMQDPQPVTLPNGRPALKGHCPVCGAGMCHIIKAETEPDHRKD